MHLRDTDGLAVSVTPAAPRTPPCSSSFFLCSLSVRLALDISGRSLVVSMAVAVVVVMVLLVVLEDWHLDVVLLRHWNLLVDGHLHLRVDGNGLLDGHLDLIGHGLLDGIRNLLLDGVRLGHGHLHMDWVGFLHLV